MVTLDTMCSVLANSLLFSTVPLTTIAGLEIPLITFTFSIVTPLIEPNVVILWLVDQVALNKLRISTK